MPLMHDDDYRLSMKLSRRPKKNDDPPADELRSLVIHRLRDAFKAVFRRSLRGGRVSAFCEYCDRWSVHLDEATITSVFKCAGCSRTFQLEFAVFSEVELEFAVFSEVELEFAVFSEVEEVAEP